MNIRYCYLVFCALCLLLDSVNSLKDNNEERIQNLKVEKNKLHKEIGAAIDDGLRTMQSNNDTDVGEGIQYLRALKLQVQEAISEESLNDTRNGSKSVYSYTEGKTSHSSNSSNSTNLRRFDFKKKKKRGPDDLDEIFIYKDVYDKKDIEPEKSKLMLDNRLKLEKKLFDWMVKRQQEKQRLKQYLEKKRAHLLEVVTEKCPRFGFGKKTKRKKKTRRDNDGNFGRNGEADAVDAHRKENKNRPKYPCCRKCCKKSYLGCL